MAGKRKDLKRIANALEAASRPVTTRDSARPDKQKMSGLFRFTVWLRVKEKRSINATAARRASPIHAYVGPNGGGKSLAMVKDTLPSLDNGRRVLSTVALLDSATGEPHEMFTRFEDWDQLLDARDCDVLMDEMVGIAGARESARLPVQVQNILVQLRRRNVVLRWSAPSWLRADKIVREVTQSVTECRGYYSKRTVATAGTEIQLWAPKRLFAFRSYDCVEFEEWTAGKRDKATPFIAEWFLGEGSRAFASYDTLDAVSRVGDVLDSGQCAVCGGVRRPKPCKCGADHVAEPVRRPGRRVAILPTLVAAGGGECVG